MEIDIWGQLALESTQVYLTDGVKRSPFADTVTKYFIFHYEFPQANTIHIENGSHHFEN